jgi:RHS repeat-associated protein
VTVTDPVGRSMAFTYNAQNHIETITDPANRVFTYGYDASDNLVSVGYPDQTTTTFQYESTVNLHLMTSIRDGQNHLTAKWVYDSQGRATESSIDGANDKVSLNYAAGNQTILTNARGFQTTYTYYLYNGIGRVSQISGPGCAACGPTNTVSYFWNFANLVDDTYDRNGIRTHYLYDLRHNITAQYDAYGLPLQRLTTYTYHPVFNLVATVTDPNGGVTSFTYDEVNRNLLQITDALPAHNATNFGYDAYGQLTTITDAQQHVTTLTYDGWGNVATVTDAQNHVTTFTYDILGNRLTATDAATPAHTTTYTYDAMNRLKTVTDPLNQVTSYDYDASARLSSLTDANSHVTTFGYDSANRVNQITAPGNRITSYGYDAEGNLTSRTDPNTQTTTFDYDSRNRLWHKYYPGGSTETFTYDNNGNLKTTSNAAISYTDLSYDLLNRLTSVTDSLGRTISYQYDANDNRTQMTAPGSDVTNYTYYANNQLWTMGPPSGPYTTFTYDSLHRRSQKVLPNTTQTTYTYDSLNNLMSLVYQTSGGQTLLSTGYTYDVLGNRLTRTDIPSLTPPPITTDPISWSYDVANQLLTRPGVTYTYDNNGNTLTKTDSSGTTTYGYDYENRLISVSAPGGMTASYTYDPFGRRISKTVNGVLTRYLYDRADMIKEYDGADTLLATYRHGPGMDEPIAMVRGGQTFYYHADWLGSVMGLTDTNQTLVQSYGYDGFGNLDQPGVIQNPYTYTGRQYDAETGLYYYRARYYDPKAGRFLQQDPIRFRGGVNFYAYVGNNPLKYRDPYGLQAQNPAEKECRAAAEGAYSKCVADVNKTESAFTALCMGFAVGGGVVAGMGGGGPLVGAGVCGILTVGCFTLDWESLGFMTGRAGCGFLRQRIYDTCMASQ